MIPIFLAAEHPPGQHPVFQVPGCSSNFCAINTDSLFSSLVAIGITLALGLSIAYAVRSRGAPGKMQMLFEFFLHYVENLVRDTVGEDARFVVPFAATIGLYILVANWLEFFPVPTPLYIPADSDVNQTLAMSVLVYLVVQGYSIRLLGIRRFLRRYTKPFDMPVWLRFNPFWIALNIIEDMVKPVTLALRLFGNIFAGALMVYLLTLVPIYLLSVPGVVIWKFFDVFFIGTIQAFIFMLLTIIYFGMAREGLEEEHGHGAGGRQQTRSRQQATP